VIRVIPRLDEFLQLKNNTKNNLIKKPTKDLNRHFYTNPVNVKHEERFSTSLFLREYKSKPH
jgi:hypothetical protein